MKAAFEKKTFDKKKTGAMTRAMAKAAFEERKTAKKVTFKTTIYEELLEKRKNVKSSTIIGFVESSKSSDNIEKVPGIGKVNKATLVGEGISTVSDLVDVFFEFEGEDGIDGAYDKFEKWLKSIGVNSYRETISMCVSAKWYTLVKSKKTKGGKKK